MNTDGSFVYSGVATIHSHLFETMGIVNTYATNEVVIKHPVTYDNSSLKIINLAGQMMATGKLKTGISLTSIDVSKLNDGVYLLIVESGIDRFVTKFYKGH